MDEQQRIDDQKEKGVSTMSLRLTAEENRMLQELSIKMRRSKGSTIRELIYLAHAEYCNPEAV